MEEFWQRLQRVERATEALAESSLPFVQEAVENISEKIVSFEPAVSVIGQVKAGKSTLLNALIGQTELLPSDVNPWTSVITAIHLNSRRRPPKTSALFRFFDEMEWDRLVTTGGRLGEMANRAGFETEAVAVKNQVMEMRQTTEQRLGDKFHDLLGASHAFETIEKDVIDRYICYGDPDDSDTPDEGVYADITKLADLYIDIPTYPTGLCFRDTPGVNDTFMMREQITLNAISDSRVCVVVLSAHQALSTMDMALMRIICNVQAREVLIFVNRIDTLVDPRGDSIKIYESIKNTLAKNGVAEGVKIIFGSGYWANCALGNTCDKMMPASRAALLHWAEKSDSDLQDPQDFRQIAFDASGVGELHRAIATRIVEGPGHLLIEDVSAEIDNISQMISTVSNIADQQIDQERIDNLNLPALRKRLDDIATETLERYDQQISDLRKVIEERLLRSRETFVASAIEALESHLATYGEFDTWSYESVSLRMMMRTAFLSTCGTVRKHTKSAHSRALEEYDLLLEDNFGIEDHGTDMEAPVIAGANPPTTLAQTLSLDLQPTWWRRFWRFGKRKLHAKRYEDVIRAETTPLIAELLEEHFDVYVQTNRALIKKFLSNEDQFVETILECLGRQDPSNLLFDTGPQQEKVA
ncbi:dynamin family protein [Puniceibacterium sp. IMCC21224]|uniref:dynamin family protein n=1 Tax=Puniceibacterium sp. IMCC21224 TaxID=1618204 RepID=UPI001E373208|nr:dynamin family protein [Puniceibacterium sp. IMCC21224]